MPIAPDPITLRRRRRRRLASVVLTLALVGVVWQLSRPRGVTAPAQPAETDEATSATPLVTLGAIRALLLQGTPLDIGRARGTLLKREVRQVIDEFLYGKFLPIAKLSKEQALALAGRLTDSIPQTQVDELEGLAGAAGVDYRDLVVLHCLPELASWQSIGCVTLTPATRADDLLFSFATDLPAAKLLAPLGLVEAVKTEGGKAFVGLTIPGLITPLVGCNDAGLCSAMLTADRPPQAEPGGLPLLFLQRHILETASDVGSAGELLDMADRTVSGSLLLAQTDSSLDAAVVEETPTEVAWRAPEEGRLVATNLLRALSKPPLADTAVGPAPRFDTLRTWLFDHAGEVDGMSRPLHETGCLTPTALVAVRFQPRLHQLWVTWQPGGDATPTQLEWQPSDGTLRLAETAVSP